MDFEIWDSGELPMAAPDGINSGGFEFWSSGEEPPVYSREEDGEEANTPMWPRFFF